MTENIEEHVMTAAGDDQAIAERVGARLREAREGDDRSVQEIATELKLTATVIGYIENGKWAQLGAPVYGRGYVRAYARALDIEVPEADELFDRQERAAGQETVAIVNSAKRQSSLLRYQRYASYVLATALLAIPAIVWVTRAFDGNPFQRQGDEETPLVVEDRVAVPASPVEPAQQDEPPMLASMTGLRARSVPPESAADGGLTTGDPATDSVPSETRPESEMEAEPAAASEVATNHTLTLELAEEVWLDVRRESGERLAFGLKPAGSVHAFDVDQGIRVRLGNAGAVAARLDDQVFDLKPHMNRDIAEFELGGETGEAL